MSDIHNSPAVLYAEWCADPDNRQVPHYVRLQCQQWLRIVNGEDPDAHIDEAAYSRICNLLSHTAIAHYLSGSNNGYDGNYYINEIFYGTDKFPKNTMIGCFLYFTADDGR